MNRVRIPRNGRGSRVSITLLLGVMSVFALKEGILMTQASELTCTNGTDHCVRQTRYPFGISVQAPVPAFQRVSLRVKRGALGTSLGLALHHADGTATEYLGGGSNSDRAAETMEAIEAYMASPQGTRSFPLRSGSRPLGWASIAAGLLLLLLIPTAYNAISFVRRGDELVVHVAQRPRLARKAVVPLAEVETVTITSRIVADQTVFGVALAVRGRAPIELGIVSKSQAHARQWARTIEANLAALLDA